MGATMTGVVLVGGGTLALALVSYSAREIGAALRHAFLRPLPGEAGRRARALWEALARSAILLGALGVAFGLVAFLSSEDWPALIVERLGEQVFGPWVTGLALAALCALPASRVAPTSAGFPLPASEESAVPRARRARPLRPETALGYVLLLALLALLAHFFPTPGARPSPRPIDWLLHGPAWLAVGAGAVAIALYLGEVRRGRSLTLGLAGAGSVGALLGLLQAFHGFASAAITLVAGGLVFSLSACVATLVGLGAVSLPLEDRAVAEGGEKPSSRLVWYGLPVATVLVVAIAWVMVSTPMKVRP
jgi:hypothetical protein